MGERKLRTPALALAGPTYDDHGCVLCPHCPEADCYAALSVRFESYATVGDHLFEGNDHLLFPHDAENTYWRVECPSGHVVLTSQDFELDPETTIPFDARMLTYVGTIIIPKMSGRPRWLPEDDPALPGMLEGYVVEARLTDDDEYAGRVERVESGEFMGTSDGPGVRLDYGYGFPLRGTQVEVDERSFESAADAAERAGVDPTLPRDAPDLMAALEDSLVANTHDGRTPPPDAPPTAEPYEGVDWNGGVRP